MFTTGNLLAFIAFMVTVVLIASILVGVICKRLTAGARCSRRRGRTVSSCSSCAQRGCWRPSTPYCRRWPCLTRSGHCGRYVQHPGHRVLSLSVIGLFLFLTGQALEPPLE